MTESLCFAAMALLQFVAAVSLIKNGLPGLALASACYGAANLAYLAIAWANIKRPPQ